MKEASEIRKQFPQAQFVRLHPVMVVKNLELGPQLERYKARVVGAGNNIVDASGNAFAWGVDGIQEPRWKDNVKNNSTFFVPKVSF